jgi:hypothetical protein
MIPASEELPFFFFNREDGSEEVDLDITSSSSSSVSTLERFDADATATTALSSPSSVSQPVEVDSVGADLRLVRSMIDATMSGSTTKETNQINRTSNGRCR